MKKTSRRPVNPSPREQVQRSLRKLEDDGLKLPRHGQHDQLEELANQLLNPPGRRGRKPTREYPWLSQRQLQTRYYRESSRDPGIMDKRNTQDEYLPRRKPVGDQEH